MIRRFFQWRAKRQLSRTRYRIDRRNYRGVFRAGFLSDLREARFWESRSDPGFRRRRRRKKVIVVLLVIGVLLLIWAIKTSIDGLRLFAFV